MTQTPAATPRRPRSRIRTAVLVVAIPLGLLVLVALPLPVRHRDASLDFCDGCGSRRYQEKIRFWSADGPSWFGREDVENIEESRVFKDWFAPGHPHRWIRAWTSLDDRLFGFRMWGYHENAVLRRAYESSPSLRSLLSEAVQEGSLTADDVRLLLGRSQIQLTDVKVLQPHSEQELVRLRMAEEVLARWTPAEGETVANLWRSVSDSQPPPPK